MPKTKRPRPAKSIRGFRPTLSTPLANRQHESAFVSLKGAVRSRDLAIEKSQEARRYEAYGRTLMAAWRRASAVHCRFAMRSYALWARVFAGQILPDDPRLNAMRMQIQARSILLARALLWQKRGVRLSEGSSPMNERRHQLIERCNAREMALLAQIA